MGDGNGKPEAKGEAKQWQENRQSFTRRNMMKCERTTARFSADHVSSPLHTHTTPHYTPLSTPLLPPFAPFLRTPPLPQCVSPTPYPFVLTPPSLPLLPLRLYCSYPLLYCSLPPTLTPSPLAHSLAPRSLADARSLARSLRLGLGTRHLPLLLPPRNGSLGSHVRGPIRLSAIRRAERGGPERPAFVYLQYEYTQGQRGVLYL